MGNFRAMHNFQVGKNSISILYNEDEIYRVKNPDTIRAHGISLVIHYANLYDMDPDQCIDLANKDIEICDYVRKH